MTRTLLLLLVLSGLPLTGQDLLPFAMPWDDASPGVTNLSGWTHSLAADDAWMRIDEDGHFRDGGNRVRIMGVNVGAAAAFPVTEMADAIAARMAKFGINGVRFHHLEAPWAPHDVLIEYTTAGNTPVGNSRTLSAERSDRLHFFVSRLKAHGIYSNINLLVSRQFFADDGLPAEIEALKWKDQHPIGFFYPPLLELQKEHATNLLTAPNPYTGLALGNDPAVAFVEILNEHGTLQAWHDATFDEMPPVFRNALRDRWNAWLSDRYTSNEELLSTWGTIDEPLGPNLLTNGDFSGGTAGWNTERHDTAVASFTETAEFTGGGPSLRIPATTAGSANWHVQLNQSGHSLAAGQIYTVRFSARGDSDQSLSATLGRTGPTDYSAVESLVSTQLGSAWQEYRATFVAGASEPSIRLNFNGFGNVTGTVWLANVRFSEGGASGAPGEGESLENGNLPIVLKFPGAAPLPRQKRDWVAFLLDLEREYYATMVAHIKETIGYPGIVFGTIVANSPPGIQAELDVIDTHAYWQHPRFPRASWDPEDWLVSNESMVNALPSNVTNIALQRVRGKPHMCTEYQHPSPITFSSEAPLLIAAYGGFQDWDGIWMFDYGSGNDDWDRGYVSGFFAMDTHPGKMANLLLASALFRRFDVAPGMSAVTIPFSDETQLEIASSRGGAWQVGDPRNLDIPHALALRQRIAMTTGPEAIGDALPLAAPSGDVHTTDTGELTWDVSRSEKGVVTVDTARTKAVIGFIDGRSFDLGGFVFQPGPNRQDWLTAGVTLVSGIGLDHEAGGRALLIVTGDQENTGQVWTNSDRESVGTNWGTSPPLIEVIPLTLVLPLPASRVSAWSLDATGSRDQLMPVTDLGNGQCQVVTGQQGATLWYEIAIAPTDEFRSGTHSGSSPSPLLGYALASRFDGRPAVPALHLDDGIPVVRFARPFLLGDASYHLDSSVDLQTWVTDPPVRVETIDQLNAVEMVEMEPSGASGAASRGFYRIRPQRN